MKRVSFKTIGCRLNQAETATMTAEFIRHGYEVVQFGGPCDAAIIHTCAVTLKAERDCMRYARMARRAGDSTIVILAGCAVEIAGTNLLARTGAHILADNKTKYNLPAVIDAFRQSATHAPLAAVSAEPAIKEDHDPTPVFNNIRAIVKVQEGCDFFCSYCIVPFTRGRPESRNLNEILDEIRRLAGTGYREVVLSGVNLGCYSDGTNKLPHLLEQIEAIEGIERIRLSSIELSTAEREVIDCIAKSEKICRYIHLPVQSGDDGILREMGRKYSSQDFRKLVDYLAAKIPAPGLGTDVIVGFPGETIHAFHNTYNLLSDLPFANIHVFTFSPRPGTKAAGMKDSVVPEEKKQRSLKLLELAKQKKKAFADRFINKTTTVLIESIDSHHIGRGWTSEYVDCRVRGQGLQINKLLDFTPSSAQESCLHGHAS